MSMLPSDTPRLPKWPFLVGDAVTDVEAALGAGCRPLMVRSGRGQAQLSKLRLQGYEAVPVVADLSEAVESILNYLR